MTKEKIKQIIVDLVIDKQGCKALDLIMSDQFIQAWRELPMNETLDDLLDELVKEERLVEVRYVLTSSSHMLKSFLLPADTLVGIKVGTRLMDMEE